MSGLRAYPTSKTGTLHLFSNRIDGLLLPNVGFVGFVGFSAQGRTRQIRSILMQDSFVAPKPFICRLL